MARMNTDSYVISLAGMLGALSLLFIYMVAIVPTGKLAMYAIASLFSIALCMEQRTIYAVIMVVGVSVLSLLILPNIAAVWPYALFFGHYGIAKFHIERLKDKLFVMLLKLGYFNIGLLLNYFIAKTIFLSTIPDFIKDNFWVFIAIAQVAFVIYDYIYSQMASLYFNKFRHFLMKRGRR
jgi:hypothetical protein